MVAVSLKKNFFKQKTAYEINFCLVGSEMCIRDRAGGSPIDFQAQQEIPTGGDVIVAVDGRPLTREDNIADLISALEPDTEVELEVVRGDERRTVDVRLAARPSRAPIE